MTGPIDTRAACMSPVDLMRLAGVEPPSAAIETILDAAYAMTPTLDQRAQWKTLSKMAWPKKRPRRIVACVGRRGLKTSGILAWTCLYETLCVPHDEHALPGTRIYALIIAPKQKQAREAVRAIKAALDQLATLGVQYVERDAAGTTEIVITNPVGRCERVIAVMTCDSVSVRGFATYFLGADESGFWPSEEWLSEVDRDVVRAIRAGMIQFPDAREVYASSPGKPGSYFHELVEKPTKSWLVVRAPSWVTNPRITEARCLADCEGDVDAFEQEYAARRFGYGGSNFIDSAKAWACIGSGEAGKGPREGSFVLGLDVGQLGDDTGIVVTSSFEVEIGPTVAPVRHVTVEHAEKIASSKKTPPSIESICARVASISRAYGEAPILFDQFAGPTVKENFRKLGFTEFVDPSGERLPSPGQFMQVSMAPGQQTPRWMLLRGLVHGARLHLDGEHGALARELCGLSATQMSSGALKVEGKNDNLADALAITLPIAVRLPPTGGPNGHIEWRCDGITHDESGFHVLRGRWSQVTPSGREVPAEWPRWAEGFDDYARRQIAVGVRTPAIIEWEREQRARTSVPTRDVG